jgi:hypothetical protein
MQCNICGNEFIPNKHSNKKIKYCSRSCCDKAFRINNREKRNAIRRRSYQKHKSQFAVKNKMNYNKNHDRRIEYQKEYNLHNKEKIKNSTKKYREEHKLDLNQKKILHRAQFNDYWKTNLFCDHCGVTYQEKELHFHHLDPAKKAFQISSMEYKSNLEIISELAKCIVLCNSCHHKMHINQRWGNPLFA